MHSLTVQEAQSPNSRSHRAVLPPKALGKGPVLVSTFWLPVITGVPWLIGASLQSLFPLSQGLPPVCLRPCSQFPSSYGTRLCWIRAHSNPLGSRLNWRHPRRPYFQIRSHSPCALGSYPCQVVVHNSNPSRYQEHV